LIDSFAELSQKMIMNLFKKNIFLIILTIVLTDVGCANHSSNHNFLVKSQSFLLPEHTIATDEAPIELWATYYYLPQLTDGSGDIPLRDLEGNELGPMLSLKDWCNSALEGSVRILLKSGDIVTYNYGGTSEAFPNDCSSIIRFNLSKTKFRLASSSFGDGVKDYRLLPYRTIATDPMFIPTGTLLYIPEARGASIQLENGETITHDGYFFAGDVGGAIKDNHIDVFVGIHENASFFPWIGNKSTATFKAYIIKDSDLINEINTLHLSRD
jgi:3D (Asp-Asp-Asp) domain-containing protein